MGSDEDEETKRWEEEQILKGVKASAPDQLTTVNPGSSHLSMLDQSFLMGTAGYGNVGTSYMTPSYVQAVQAYAGITPQGVASETPPTGGSSGTAGTTKNSFRIPEKLVPITLESLKSRLSNRLRDLQDGVSGHRERLGQIRADLERSREEVGVAESKRGDLGARYQYYQEIRGYLRDLLSCLGEKVRIVSSSCDCAHNTPSHVHILSSVYNCFFFIFINGNFFFHKQNYIIVSATNKKKQQQKKRRLPTLAPSVDGLR